MLEVCVWRTTLSDVARSAGVSRMTLYRSFPDAAAMLGELMTREFAALIGAVESEVASLPTARERLVEATKLGAGRLAEDPLLARVITLDPELLLPYMTDRIGQTQRVGLAVIERYLAAGAEDGSIRSLRSGAAAVLMLLTQGFAISGRIVEPQSAREEAIAELGEMLDAYLEPRG